ncbi:MAG: CPBP family intramembrane metalloprotease [Thermoplasmata archaeon]|nr:CPBP family intramembrane metalloprotease [Thermoplasmata archaeon]MCI4337887.1 CPBP family intramembrane metalloprotease [Thermoplasmata archaeon]MCI4340844.1 CPBP family intramembrane metalloprotease [Thermoplasmata archaeon]
MYSDAPSATLPGTASSPPAPTAVAGGASLGAYALATVITVFAVISQYFLPSWLPGTRWVYGNLPGDLAIVYGVPILSFLLLVGTAPLRHWQERMGHASVEGLRWFGLYSLLALLLSFIALILYQALDPAAVRQLSRSVPVVQGAAGNPWFWIALSFAVGAIEETIFRGWIFGYWLSRFPGQWQRAAIGSSLLFAGVHLYYWGTYGVIAPVPLITLTMLGLAFSWAMALSGGNLVIVALLHGAFDATSFYSLVNLDVALALHYGLVLLGLGVAAAVAIRQRTRPRAPRYAPVPLPPPGF